MTRRPWEDSSEPDNPLLEAALESVERGWKIFPCAPGGKVPLIAKTNWREIASSDPDQVRAWWRQYPNANHGVATGEVSGVSVVDVDIKDGRAGEDSAIKLGLAYHDTLTVRTASGGWHYYFNHPEGFRNRAGVLPGIDTRGDGGYVVGPGSVIDGDMYDVINVGDTQEMPASVLHLVGTRAENDGQVKPDSASFDVDVDEVRRIRKALGYLDSDGYETWLTVGMALYELAGGSDQMFELWDWWSSSSPKYDHKIMRGRWSGFASERPDKVTEDTFWFMARAEGYIDEAADLIFVPEKSDSLAFSGRELKNWQPPQLDNIELWRDSVVARGNMTLIAGPPKVGKSMFVQHLLMSGATGRDFLGYSFPRAVRVLWLQAEIRKVYLRATRIDPAIAAAGYSPDELESYYDNFYMTDRLDLEITTKREFDVLAKVVADISPDILVIDPIINFSAAKENDAKETKELLRAARQLARAGGGEAETEPALVIIHHTKKIDPNRGPGPDPFDLIRGSGAFRGYYDSGMMLLPDSSENLALYFETRNQRSPDRMGLRFDGELSKWELVDLGVERAGDGTFSALSDARADQRIIAAANILKVQREPYAMAGGAFKAALMASLGVSDGTAKAIIRDALDNPGGQVNKRGDGRSTVYVHSDYVKFYDSMEAGK